MKRFFVSLFLGTCLALVYVQQRVLLIALGYQVEALAAVRDDLLDQHRVLNYNVLALESPVILDGRLAQRDVQLTPPKAVEILLHRFGTHSSQPVATPLSQPESSWWQQAWELTTRWLEGGRQAVAAPAPGGER